MRREARLALEGLGLAAVLLFVAAVAYLPHADSASHAPAEGSGLTRFGITYWNWLVERETDDYEYPVHVDENVHWARMADVERQETLRTEGIYSGVPKSGTLTLRGLVHENGYTLAVVHLKELTGADWLSIIRFLPALWAAVTAFLVWAALRPWHGAWVAALLVGLIPTSARFLGPGFFVPSGMGLAWIAAVLILAPTVGRRNGAAPVLLVMVTAWAFFIHLLSGFAALLLLLCLLPLRRNEFRSLLMMAITIALPILAMLEVFMDDVVAEFQRATLPIDFSIWDQFGLAFLAFWVLGSALTWTRPAGTATVPIRAATLASIVAFSFIVYALVSRAPGYAFYDRWHQPFALFAIVPVAFAVMTVGQLVVEAARWLHVCRPHLRIPRPGVLALPVSAIAFFAVLGPGLTGHVQEPYYQTITDADYARYVWTAANTDGTYAVFLDHPWKSMTFHAMTGKEPATYLRPGSPPVNNDAWMQFDRGEGVNAAWLVEKDISVVFAERLDVEGYQQARSGIYLLNEAEARALAALLAQEDR